MASFLHGNNKGAKPPEAGKRLDAQRTEQQEKLDAAQLRTSRDLTARLQAQQNIGRERSRQRSANSRDLRQGIKDKLAEQLQESRDQQQLKGAARIAQQVTQKIQKVTQSLTNSISSSSSIESESPQSLSVKSEQALDSVQDTRKVPEIADGSSVAKDASPQEGGPQEGGALVGSAQAHHAYPAGAETTIYQDAMLDTMDHDSLLALALQQLELPPPQEGFRAYNREKGAQRPEFALLLAMGLSHDTIRKIREAQTVADAFSLLPIWWITYRRLTARVKKMLKEGKELSLPKALEELMEQMRFARDIEVSEDGDYASYR
jgi:hypothetical protein